MIEVKDTEKYCNSCMNEKGNKSIRIGITDTYDEAVRTLELKAK
ncbi:hypothetical protein [Paenibacillus pini]|nr:hypothetical protein [Paenibacillus pini]